MIIVYCCISIWGGVNLQSEELAWKIRRKGIDMVHRAHASHIASILSCADIMSVLYSDILRYDCSNPQWDERDRLILSKGHSGVALYIALAESGFFPESVLDTYGQDGSVLSCHISHKGVSGVELSTGSLGHGVCVACGMALNGKLKRKNYHVYAVIGDGECNEGSVWEMAMLAVEKELNNFTVVIDKNGMQAMGCTKDIMKIDNMAERWQAFGWQTLEIDGHDHDALRKAFYTKSGSSPCVIISNTVKGHGVSFMENNLLWHYKDPQDEYYKIACKELDEKKPRGLI